MSEATRFDADDRSLEAGGPAGQADAVRISAITKVRMIVEALPGADDLVGISELARHLGLPKSTVSRICAELVQWGVVARVGQAVGLGPRLAELGALAPLERESVTSLSVLRCLARPHMVDLHAELRAPVVLSVLAGADTLCIERIVGTIDVRHAVEVGSRGPAHLTAAGRAILAHSKPSDVERLFERPLERRTRYSVINPPVIVEELRQVRAQGVAVIRDQLHVGKCSLAVPVVSESGNAIAAISVTMGDDSSEARFGRALRRCGAKVSAAARGDDTGRADAPAG